MKPKFAIVLVSPQGDANIGAAARAMKNFGFRDLRIVGGVPHLTRISYTWAVDARDVLENAKTFDKLDDALGDLTCAVAFTRRIGKLRRTHMELSESGPLLIKKARSGGIAFVFGREDKGLSNNEIKRCDYIITIPTSNDLPSLNLAQSVLLACHEVFKYPGAKSGPRQEFAPKSEIKGILKRLGKTLDFLGYNDLPPCPLRSRILAQFEKLFGRGGLTKRDIQMLEGFASRIMAKS